TAFQAFYYLGAFALLPLLALPSLLQARPKTLALVIAVGSVYAASLLTVGLPHYLAPVAAPIYALVAGGMWQLYHRRNTAVGWGRIAKLAALLTAATAIAQTATALLPFGETAGSLSSGTSDDFGRQRQAVSEGLFQRPGSDLVFVSYGEQHHIDNEWVYNRADIDASRVVWARDMGARANQELMAYYPEREVWALRSGLGSREVRTGEREEIELTHLRSPLPEATQARD
ncbi:MAG: hypothetical protein ACR2QM_16840, partial [Longimicrobiales bacterium]